MLMLSVLAIVLVPSLYALFYITSFWDPYSHLDRMPAALINADSGAPVSGREVNLGNRIVDTFKQNPPFRFIYPASMAEAEAALHRGDIYFILVIPADFSERALAARKDAPAMLSLEVAEGDSYTSAIISRRFGSELAHTLNEQLNAERWAAIVGSSNTAATDTLRIAVAQLRDGSEELHAGAQRLQVGSAQLDQGLDRLAAGLQEMHDRLPTTNQLEQLATGSEAVVMGESKLADGLDQLAAGGERLQQGADQLRQGADRVPIGSGRLTTGATQLETGIATLETNLQTGAAAGHELHAGLEQLNNGVQPLASGLPQLEAGLQQMLDQFSLADTTSLSAAGSQTVRLGEGSRQLAAGSKELETGSAQLEDGLDRLQNGLNEQLGSADAEGLAASVQVDIKSYAPVQNNGTAYCPYFTALALWLGGIMITFVFHCRRLIEPMKAAPRWVCWLAKSAVPLALGVLQATVIVMVFHFGLGISFVHPWLVWLAAALGSLTFVLLVLLLIALLGDAGRLPAVVLLMLQLAAAGGIYPIQLSGPFYEAIHPYMPLTALVNALRATMFGAFDGAWLAPALQLVVTGAIAMAITIGFARWKYVPRDAYGPAVEFS